MPGLDLTNWPVWAVLVLVAINTFNKPLGALMATVIPAGVRSYFRARTRRQADREEFSQAIGETLVDGTVQHLSAAQLADTRREKWFFDQLGRRDLWIQETLCKQLDGLTAAAGESNELLTAIVALLESRLPK